MDDNPSDGGPPIEPEQSEPPPSDPECTDLMIEQLEERLEMQALADADLGAALAWIKSTKTSIKKTTIHI